MVGTLVPDIVRLCCRVAKLGLAAARLHPGCPRFAQGRGGRLTVPARAFFSGALLPQKPTGPRATKSESQNRRPRPIRRGPERWVKRLFVSPKIEQPGWSAIIWQASADQLDAADRPISYRHTGGGVGFHTPPGCLPGEGALWVFSEACRTGCL